MGRLAKFWSLTRSEKKLLCEAGILLFFSNIIVRAIAFKHIDRFLRVRWNDGIHSGNDREPEISALRRSVTRAKNIVPGKNLCLSRSIAEFVMLRRRGIPAVISAGARISGDSIEAHAWVDTGLSTHFENSDFKTVITIGRGVAQDRR